MQVVGVVVLLGPRVEDLVSTILGLEAKKRSRFPPGLEPRGKATATGGAGAGAGVATANSGKVKYD